MGCDGGTIPTRGELVKTKKRKAKLDRQVENSAKWKHCAVSQQPLRTPIVASRIGKLYNKDALIEALLKQKKTGELVEGMDCVESLKDVKEVNLTRNPAYHPEQGEKEGRYDSNAAEFICPIAGVEMNGLHRFFVFWSCGCVVSEKAFKELASTVCPNCAKPFNADDKIILYGSAEEVDCYRKLYAQKKAAKVVQKQKIEEQPSCSGTSVPKKAKLSAATGDKIANGNGTSSKSIQNDPSVSKVFKSLFTTCDEARNRPQGHWVTYNPLYQ